MISCNYLHFPVQQSSLRAVYRLIPFVSPWLELPLILGAFFGQGLKMSFTFSFFDEHFPIVEFVYACFVSFRYFGVAMQRHNFSPTTRNSGKRPELLIYRPHGFHFFWSQVRHFGDKVFFKALLARSRSRFLCLFL